MGCTHGAGALENLGGGAGCLEAVGTMLGQGGCKAPRREGCIPITLKSSTASLTPSPLQSLTLLIQREKHKQTL